MHKQGTSCVPFALQCLESTLLIQIVPHMGTDHILDWSGTQAQHRIQVDAEQQKAKDTTESLRQLRKAEEERVATLENKLAELSEVVGNYDRVKQQDQLAIQ